jgi:hypothetical protein
LAGGLGYRTNRLSKRLFQLLGRLFRRARDQLCPAGGDPYFGQEALNRIDADLGPVVALGQVALGLGTGNHAHAPASVLQGVEKVLSVGLAAARDLPNHDMQTILHPLPRQLPAAGDTILAHMYKDVGTNGLGHRSSFRAAAPCRP